MKFNEIICGLLRYIKNNGFDLLLSITVIFYMSCQFSSVFVILSYVSFHVTFYLVLCLSIL